VLAVKIAEADAALSQRQRSGSLDVGYLPG
jgi:hypothetical protein